MGPAVCWFAVCLQKVDVHAQSTELSKCFPFNKINMLHALISRLTYWGETPLTFAACLDLDHVFRSLWVKGADINAQDTNGNTVLHMMVLHDKKVSSCDLPSADF